MTDKTEAPSFAADGKTPLHSIPGVELLVSAADFNRQHAEIQQLKAEKQHALDVADAQKEHIAELEAQIIAQTNRAAAAVQQVTALTQRLDAANVLNTEARNQLAQLSARQAVPTNRILALEQEAHSIFNDPPSCTPQEVRDVIEWYAASVRVALSAAPPPPEREPLTDEQIIQWWASDNGLEDCDMAVREDFILVVHAVQTKLGITPHGIGAANECKN